MYPSVPTSTVYNSQDMKTTKMTTGRQMNKEDVEYIYIYIHTYIVEHYSAMKKNEIMPFAAACMNLEMIMLKQRKTDIICC